MKHFRIAVLSATLVVLTAACSSIVDPDDGWRNKASAESRFNFAVETGSMIKLVMEGINGTINIVGKNDGSQVKVSGVKIVRSDSERDGRDFLKKIKVSLSETSSTLFVATEQPENLDGREVNVDYEITVPQRWLLSVSSVNGECALDSLQGEIDAQVSNGNVSLGKIDASATVRVTNGRIAGTVNLPRNGKLHAQTTNGLIVIDLAKETSAQFLARVTNGTVNVSGLTLRDVSGSQKEVRGVLGTGEGTIDLRTTNGNISVSGY